MPAKKKGAICICVHVQSLPGRLVYGCVVAKVATDTVYFSDSFKPKQAQGRQL